MISNKNRTAQIGKLFLILSFVFQVLLLILVYRSNILNQNKSGLSLLTDSLACSMYISFGSCATQFFLIRLFSFNGKSNVRNMILYIAFVVINHWNLLYALYKGYPLSYGDIASLLFEVILAILVIITVLSRLRFFAILSAIGAIAMTIYNVFIISCLNNTISHSLLVGMIISEVLYGIGLFFSLLGVRKA